MFGSLLYRLLFSLTLVLPTWVTAETVSDPDRLRDRYRAAQMALSRGEITRFRQIGEELRAYPLYPWIRYQDINRRRSSAKLDEVEAFLKVYGTDLVGKTLRSNVLDTYFSQRRWQDYLRVSAASDTDSDARRCEHALALLNSGAKSDAFAESARIWPSPRSLPRVCDSLFERWYAAGNPHPDLAWQRFHLALNNNEQRLAEYLVRFLDNAGKRDAQTYLTIAKSPARVQQLGANTRPGERASQMIEYGIRQVARRQPREAGKLLKQYASAGSLGVNATRDIARRIQLGLTSESVDEALEWSLGLPDDWRSDELREDSARYALRTGQWQRVDEAITRLSDRSRNEPRWRYWALREHALTGKDTQIEASQWRALAAERSYYGFLSADQIREPYEMQHLPVRATETEMAQLRAQPGIARALEFDALGNTLQSRREWMHTVARLGTRDRELAAQLAFDKGWHQLAMLALIAAESWHDLGIRFPILFADDFQQAARRSKIENTWLFAIARQESMFDPNARSPAGAMGLMQLMPSTARLTARAHGLTYGGTDDLRKPATNVALGSRFMKSMLNDFDNNRALAAAAYNAGPSRVKQWLKGMPAEIPHDVFVESIPFKETRQYVQNTLSFAVIYAYLQGQPAPLMRPQEQLIRNRQTRRS